MHYLPFLLVQLASNPVLAGVPQGLMRPAIPPPLSSVYAWGGGLSVPLRLPMLNTEVVQVSAGRTQKAGVTRSGRLILWEVRLAVGLFQLGGGGIRSGVGVLRRRPLPCRPRP